MDVTARRNVEQLTEENQEHALEFGAKSFSKYLSGTTQMARQIAETIILTPQVRSADLTKSSALEQMVSPIILATLKSSPSASFCRFQTPDGLVSGFRRFDDGAIRHFFANQSSAPPSSSTGYSTMPLFIVNVDRFGNPTSPPKSALPGDFRETAPYKETLITGKMAWGIVWAYNSTLVFLAAQAVRDPVSNVTLGVALGTATTVTLSNLLASNRPQHAGLLYVFEAETGKLICSSDLTGLYGSMRVTSDDASILVANASNPLMRGSARVLFKDAATKSLSQVGNASFESVDLAGAKHYVSSIELEVEGKKLVTVMVIPRSVTWDDIDKTSSRELIIISAITAGVLVLGCVLIVLLTCRVSREMLLRAQLIRSMQLKEQAEKASDYKSQFLAAMSHDVRTPLCCIIGLLEVLLGDSRLHIEQRSSLKQVRLCALQLLDLLKSILDLSKVESGKLTLEPGPFDLGQELEALVDMFAVQCAKKNVALVLDLDDCLPRKVVGDCARVRQILANLVGNAVTFTNEGQIVVRASPSGARAPRPAPRPILKALRTMVRSVSQRFSRSRRRTTVRSEGSGVRQSAPPEPRQSALAEWIAGYANKLRAAILSRVTAEQAGKITVVFEVDDTGVGIPPSRRKAVLGSFTQGSRQGGGYGLGLAMVRNLVTLMRGGLHIEDKQGPGTLFRFHIVLELPPSYEESPFSTPKGTFKSKASRRATATKTSQVAASPFPKGPSRRATGVNTPGVNVPQFVRQELSLLEQVEGGTVLLLKADRVGREAAAGWMTRRGFRVLEAERWGGLRHAFRVLLGGKHTVWFEDEEADDLAELRTGQNGRPNGDVSPDSRVRRPSRFRQSEGDAVPGEKGTDRNGRPDGNVSSDSRVRRPSAIRQSGGDPASSDKVTLADSHLFGQLLEGDSRVRPPFAVRHSGGEPVPGEKVTAADSQLSGQPLERDSRVRRPTVTVTATRHSGGDSVPGEKVTSAGSRLFGQPLIGNSTRQSGRGKAPGTCFLILDTAVVPGFPSPEALATALRSLMEEYDPTAPNAPRVVVAWLVSFALPGAVYEEMRSASGCRIIAYDVLHPSRLMSLLTAMVSDNPNPDVLLGSAVPAAAAPVWSQFVRSPKKAFALTEEERQEVLIQSGMAFASTRGAVDEKGPERAADSAPSGGIASSTAERVLSQESTTTSATNGDDVTEIKAPASLTVADNQAGSIGVNQTGGGKEIVSPGKEPGGTGLALAGVHVLIVEDTVMLRKLATTILTRVGAKVFAVENGRQAVNAVLAAMALQLCTQKAAPSLSEFGPPADALAEDLRTSGCFDLVLMDCQMPVLDGYGATIEIRQLEQGENVHVPIVALTAHAMATDKEKCLSVGMDG
ncbi:Signal transduction histidine kinase [Klebsormidium nitens]|uniref:histidine kinase n=1 Tax=Klebsormidium nitens TaxID=105231 RepID=A0A1Y1IC43_KLENI|nr:Signal transduction histidine kinase [Klebsormidium nitens]|eukprot:GAQ86661.1 Signal transduction histidine kinase [Klebsormidium nitens]